MSTLSSVNVTGINLVLKEHTHKIKMTYSVHQYSNSYEYFRQLAHVTSLAEVHSNNNSGDDDDDGDGDYVTYKSEIDTSSKCTEFSVTCHCQTEMLSACYRRC